jgi:hypothetical protein
VEKCVIQFVSSNGQKSKAGGLLLVVGIRPVADAAPDMKKPAMISAAKTHARTQGVARQWRGDLSGRRCACDGSVVAKICFEASLLGGLCRQFCWLVIDIVCLGFDFGGAKLAEFQIGHRAAWFFSSAFRDWQRGGQMRTYVRIWHCWQWRGNTLLQERKHLCFREPALWNGPLRQGGLQKSSESSEPPLDIGLGLLFPALRLILGEQLFRLLPSQTRMNLALADKPFDQ